MDYLATPAVAKRPMAGTILLTDAEFTSEPLHITVVGKKKDASAIALFGAALAAPGSYNRIEWWNPASGKPLRADIQYPQLHGSAAFLCTSRACSSPLFSADALTSKLSRVLPGVTASNLSAQAR